MIVKTDGSFAALGTSDEGKGLGVLQLQMAAVPCVWWSVVRSINLMVSSAQA